jgi:hypothetical protein
MKIICPSCQVKFLSADIKKFKKNGFHLEKQCPHCQNWFRLETKLMVLKTLGLITLLTASLFNILELSYEHNLLVSSIGFVGIVIALVIILTGKHQVINK